MSVSAFRPGAKSCPDCWCLCDPRATRCMKCAGTHRRKTPIGGPDDPRHGTRGGYVELDCRCDKCRVANATYAKSLARDYSCEHCGAIYAKLPSQKRRFCCLRCAVEHNIVPLEERFWAKVDKAGPDECWLWRGRTISNGYGKIWAPKLGRPDYTHRVAYELLVGPIPAGLTIDHLCLRRACVNPAHLEPVTRRENTLRQHARLRQAKAIGAA